MRNFVVAHSLLLRDSLFSFCLNAIIIIEFFQCSPRASRHCLDRKRVKLLHAVIEISHLICSSNFHFTATTAYSYNKLIAVKDFHLLYYLHLGSCNQTNFYSYLRQNSNKISGRIVVANLFSSTNLYGIEWYE